MNGGKKSANNKQRGSRGTLDVDRRSFLRMTTAAGAGLVLAPKILGDSKKSKSDGLNIALLGVGAQGQVLMNSCLKIPGIRIRAVCDIWTAYNLKRASGLLGKYGHEHRTYEDYRDMLHGESDLDAVIIATPDVWHAEHTVNCLKAGLHVYCEKEMSNTLEGAQNMVKTARETGRLLQIGHQRRSNPRYLHCFHQLLKQARILGRITTANAQWNRSVQPDIGWPKKYPVDQETLEKYGYESMHQFRNWRWYRHLGGGPIVDLGSHQIDIFNWFLDSLPRSVMSIGTNDYYDESTHQWHDTVMAVYQYKNRDGIVTASYQTITTNSNQGYYEVFMGDQATLLISESAGRAGLFREPSAPGWDKWMKMNFLKEPTRKEEKPPSPEALDVRETMAPPRYDLPVVFNDPYHKPHLENFLYAIRGTAKLNCPPEIGYETAVSVLKVNQAIDAGRALSFNPDEFTV